MLISVVNRSKTLSDADLQQFSDAIAKLPPPQPPAEAPDAPRMERARALIQQRP